jgi:hypothetical protein
MKNCDFPQNGNIIALGTDINLYNTINIGSITGTACELEILGCMFADILDDYNIAGTCSGSIINTYFIGPVVAAIQSTNTLSVIGCSTGGVGSLNDTVLTQLGMAYHQPIATQGNVMQGVTVTVSMTPYIVQNNVYFIGVNNSVIGGQVLFNDPGSSGPFNDGQVFIVKDVMGNASTFSIEITSSDGILFDGETSIILNSRFASVTLRYNGTDFNIL